MRRHLRRITWGLLCAASISGTLADRVPRRVPLLVGGYRVLTVDLHVHSFPLSASTLTPLDLVFEARHRGLDAIAITGHNEVFSGKLGRWFSRVAGGPTVIEGEEIHGPEFHLIAAGIHRSISWRLTSMEAIDEVHRQGGIAIAAHPTSGFWPAFDAQALGKLDGTEVGQPVAFHDQESTDQIREFYRRSGAAAIGSSDWHGMGPLGLCRTFVFAKDDTEASILEAIRAHRTVVVDRGESFGNAALAKLAGDRLEQPPPASGMLHRFSAIGGVLGLFGVALLSFPMALFRRDPPPAPDKARAAA